MEMRAEREIDRPAGEVFDYLADASNNPVWQNGMTSCRWTSEGSIGIGSTYEQVARFGGRDIRSTFEVVEYDAGQHIRIKTIESTFPIDVRRTVEPIDEQRCRVTAVVGGGPEGVVGRVFAPVMDRMARRSIERDYDRLVEVLHGAQ